MVEIGMCLLRELLQHYGGQRSLIVDESMCVENRYCVGGCRRAQGRVMFTNVLELFRLMDRFGYDPRLR